MKSTDYFNRTIETLRRLETYGYQLAYYILRDEELAMDATKRTLLALAEVDEFCYMPVDTQRDLLKKRVTSQSIRCRHEMISV
ncbi:hypothetical protein [Paenibacillus crassostreae]|uniref:Uncharacterized protein n=1 Tax=Paenibacillus crassostreae TaxID=1763538 RepID=A0A167DUS8_9BACL|nr:hypothetical protein [Paenibacillus crassostreae]AOZ91036.1 hypothetical protein LPB68_01675 [Paenibacillus crassostreae]OAB74801.1 hypothetical protein PNBC_12280 [Paenibacillus crassostreae]